MSKSNLKAPKGSAFLPNTSMQYLKNCYKKETNIRVRDRLLAYMQRKDGKSLTEIAKNLNRCKSTIHDWITRAHQEGIRGRHERSGRGRKYILDENQREELFTDLDQDASEFGFESSLWDSNLIRRHIQKKFGVEYTRTGIRDLLNRNGFSWTKSRPKNPRSASKQAQNKFKKETKELVKEKAAQGYTIMVGDAAAIERVQNNPHYGWRRKGSKPTSLSYLSHAKRYAYGVLGVNFFFHKFYDKINSNTFIKFLKSAHKRYGKICLFLDNAAPHKSKKVQEFVELCNGEIILNFLPPYTPELNPIEMMWREMKRILAQHVYPTLDDMERAVRRAIRKKELRPIKMFDYFTP